jgi:hypothetical protein
VNFSQLVQTELPREWVELYRSERIDTDRLRLSYQRFTSRRALVPKRGWLRGAFVAALLTASAGIAYAATGVALRHYRASESSGSQNVALHARHPSAATHASPTKSMTVAPPLTSDSATSLSRFPELETEDPNTPTRATPAMRWSRPKAATPRTKSSIRSPIAVNESPWERAARGLRSGDYRTADNALAEIEANGNTRERESASLSRAQLLMAQGQRLRASAVLRDLSNSTQSANVRAKAEELLRRLEPAGAQ